MNVYAADPVFMPLAFFGGGMGGGEVLVVLIVLLLLFGARRLPELARALGGAIAEFRCATGNLTRDIMLDATPAPAAPCTPAFARPPVNASPNSDTGPFADAGPVPDAAGPQREHAPPASDDNFTPPASADSEK